MGEVLLDALLDSLKIFPFLFLLYVLIEFLEHRTSVSRNKNLLRGGLAPLLGAAVGMIPQCGFSVMAAKLYDKKTHPHGHRFSGISRHERRGAHNFALRRLEGVFRNADHRHQIYRRGGGGICGERAAAAGEPFRTFRKRGGSRHPLRA